MMISLRSRHQTWGLDRAEEGGGLRWARLGRVVLPAAVLFLGAPARAEDAAPLSDGQRAARDAFHEAVQDKVLAVREACGLELPVASDFEHFDLAAWTGDGEGQDRGKGAAAPPRHLLRTIAVSCIKTIDALYSLCRFNADKAAWKPVVAREVKGVRCLFSGVKARRPGESTDVFARRNLSFEQGQLTVHLTPDLQDIGQNPVLVLMAGLAGKPGAPSVRKDILHTGDRGEQCASGSDCGSRLCLRAVCTACSSKAACQPGLRCDQGVCRTPQELREIAAHLQASERSRPAQGGASAPGRPAGKGLGVGCRSSAECRSGLTCKPVSPSRSTCR